MVAPRELDFGSASAETDNLNEYFVETDVYHAIKGGKIDFILGLKGSGKSSIFKVLPKEESETLLIVQANSLSGEAEYEKLIPLAGTDVMLNFRNIWKLYTAIVIGRKIIEKYGKSHESNTLIKQIRDELEAMDIIEENGLKRLLSKIKDYLPELTIDTGNLKFTLKSQKKDFKYYKVLEWINEFLDGIGVDCWILFDRLDEFFNQDDAQRKLALEGLLFAYSDMNCLKRISKKIFLRKDIYDTLEYENKDHFRSSVVEINWDLENLMMLIAKRLAKNSDIMFAVTSTRGNVQITQLMAHQIFNSVFENKVEKGEKQSKTESWIYKRIINGQNIATPRDMISFCTEAKTAQMGRKYETKDGKPISGRAVKDAFPKFSEHKLTDYIYSVFPEIKFSVEKFRGSSRPKFHIKTLKTMLQDGEDTIFKIRKLYDIGFLAKIGNNPVENTEFFEVPLMYRPALGIKTVGRKKNI